MNPHHLLSAKKTPHYNDQQLLLDESPTFNITIIASVHLLPVPSHQHTQSLLKNVPAGYLKTWNADHATFVLMTTRELTAITFVQEIN
jgi:hypothetical protein